MTDALPDTGPAIRELERTIAERKAHIAKSNPAGAINRLLAMQLALLLVEKCADMTYFETNGNPTSPKFQPVD